MTDTERELLREVALASLDAAQEAVRTTGRLPLMQALLARAEAEWRRAPVEARR